MIFGLLAAVGAWVAAGVAAVAGGTATWKSSRVSRQRRRARRAIRPLRKEGNRFERTLEPWSGGARAAAEEWAVADLDRRLREVPIESLRDAGARNVRWSALAEAGWTTLADLRDKSAEEIAAVDGVGATSAERVAAARDAMAKRVEEDTPAMPSPELATAEAASFAEGTLEVLEAHDIAGDAPGHLRQETRRLERRYEGERSAASFPRFVAGLFRRERRREDEAEAEALAAEAERVRDGGLLESAREGRRRLHGARKRRPKRRRGTAPAPDPARVEALRERFRSRFVECCALIEELYVELGLRSDRTVSRGRGGVTEEVARRVEEFPLDASGLRARLRRYQEFGAKFLLAQERTLLGDEMGLGKTMQALAVMGHLRSTEDGSRFFVVAPAGILINWVREVERFTGLGARLLHGSRTPGELEAWVRDGGVAITSYATLRTLDLGAALERASGVVDFLVVDEAHYAKNPDAARTQAVRALAERSRYVAFLSGTPMENRPAEFVNLVEAIRPAEGKALRDSQDFADAGASSVRRFHAEVASLYLRRNQEDVLTELPEKIEVEEWVELRRSDRRAYFEAVADRNFMGMRRAATLGSAEEGPVSAKLDRLEELLEDHRASQRKVIVFSYFLDVLAAVARRFETIGTVDGSVSPEDRQALIDELAAAEGHAMLLLQIQAGGQGLNIQCASAVVLLEPQTKPSLEDQAIARAHRMGQTKPVLVHRILARRTCDETMLELLGEKSRLFEAYARQSSVKEASREATETSLAKAVVDIERARLAEAGPGGAAAG